MYIYICACVCERRCILLCLCAVWPVGQPRVNAGSRFPGCAAQPPLGSILRLQWVLPCFLANQFQFQRLDNQKIQDASSLWCFWCFSPMYATSIYCIPRLEARLWAMVSLQVHGNTRTSGQIGKTRQLSERAKGVGYFKAESTGWGHLGQEPLKHMCQVPHERSKTELDLRELFLFILLVCGPASPKHDDCFCLGYIILHPFWLFVPLQLHLLSLWIANLFVLLGKEKDRNSAIVCRHFLQINCLGVLDWVLCSNLGSCKNSCRLTRVCALNLQTGQAILSENRLECVFYMCFVCALRTSSKRPPDHAHRKATTPC